jgi:hypothetical protein
MIAAMESNGGYYERPHRYPFSWNVKWPYMPSADAAATLEPFNESGESFNSAWDSAWQAEMESDGFDSMIIESLRFGVEDFSDYDGNEWAISFGGRQGGHLLLESGAGFKLAGFDLDDLRDAEQYSFADVRRLYRAFTVMDSDFSRESVRKAFLHELAFRRSEWEAERRERIASLESDAIGDAATAVALIGELKAAKRACPIAAPVICRTIRKAIATAIRDRRDSLRQAAALRALESTAIGGPAIV